MPVRVYLDNCAIQRPLDTPTQIRIILEANAVLGLFRLWELGELKIVSSDALVYEANQLQVSPRREHAQFILQRVEEVLHVTDSVRALANRLVQEGFKPMDALHLALAEVGNVDYFCTCDDRLLRKAKKSEHIKVRVVSPIELVKELEQWP